MTDEEDLSTARMLYRIAPGERLEYASRYPLLPGASSEPETTEVGYDVVIAVEGSGYIAWDGEKIPINPGMSVAVPPEATYTITADPEYPLDVLIAGISSDTNHDDS